MNSASLSRTKGIPAVFRLAVVAVALGPGCFRGADISKIVCNDTKYCPSGYVCVVPPGKTQGSCQRSGTGDASGSEAIAADGVVGIDGARALDSAALDMSGGGVDQALGNADGGGSPMDTSVGVDMSSADVPPESPKINPMPSVCCVDIPLSWRSPAPTSVAFAGLAPALIPPAKTGRRNAPQIATSGGQTIG